MRAIANRHKKHTIESIKQHAAAEKYRVLSVVYRNPHDRIDLECPKGHIYTTMWMQFYRGERCRQCRFEVMTIEKVKAYLDKEKYHLLSTEYKNPHTKMLALCANKHQYRFTWSDFKRGFRCGECAKQSTTSKREAKLGELLEQIFVGYCVQSQDNLGFLGKLKVDFSVKELNLAFEYDGEHHFEPTTYGGMSQQEAEQRFKKQQERDYRKNLLCSKNDITLIRIECNEPLTIEHVRDKIVQSRSATSV